MKRFKCLISLSSIVLLNSPITILIAGCSQGYKEVEVPILNSTGGEMFKTKIMFKNNSSIAYIGLENAMSLVKQMHALFMHDNKYDYTITKTNGMYNVKNANGTMLDIEPSSGKLTFSDFYKFVTSASARVTDLANDLGGFEPSTSQNVKYIAYGDIDTRKCFRDKRVINLSEYNISLIESNGTVYFPLQTISDLFLNAIGCPVFAIKNAIIPSIFMPRGETGKKSEFPAYIANNKLEVNQELLDFNYNETCLWLDLDYGFKERKSIQSFDQIFRANSYDNKKSLRDCMLSSPEENDKALDWVIAHIFDDGHSGYINNNIYNNDEFNSTQGEYTSRRIQTYFHYYFLRDKVWPSEEFEDVYPQYSEIKSSKATEDKNDFAYITFDSFTSIPENFKKEDIPADPRNAPRNNAFALFTSAYAWIYNNDNIKNIVIDLSNNSGGDATFCLWLCSLLVGDQICSTIRSTLDSSVNLCSYCADADLDGKVNYSDMNFSNKNIYILTSPVSFSCANMLPTILKQHTNVKIIGQKSGGGSCIVHPGCNALGTFMQISGSTQIGYLYNGTFYDNEEGIEPSYLIDESQFYGPTENPRKNLTEIIVNNLQ